MKLSNLTRRTGIAAALMGLVSASCASAKPHQDRRISFQDTLEILNSVATLSEFESAVGRFGFVNYFAHDDESNQYYAFTRGRNYWEGLYISNPPSIMQTLRV